MNYLGKNRNFRIVLSVEMNFQFGLTVEMNCQLDSFEEIDHPSIDPNVNFLWLSVGGTKNVQMLRTLNFKL